MATGKLRVGSSQKYISLYNDYEWTQEIFSSDKRFFVFFTRESAIKD
jgi:hypothetical protein